MEDRVKFFFGVMFLAYVIGSWPYNFYKATQCDFEPDYKCEVIHAIGIFMPPASLITVWFDADQ